LRFTFAHGIAAAQNPKSRTPLKLKRLWLQRNLPLLHSKHIQLRDIHSKEVNLRDIHRSILKDSLLRGRSRVSQSRETLKSLSRSLNHQFLLSVCHFGDHL
jgi:hypothetical protein